MALKACQYNEIKKRTYLKANNSKINCHRKVVLAKDT